ncbi:hypothetical protein LCGC14_0311170 [marine sediment metagenome]|uniref:Uncharacterized protein n=1 Tax=marine sediment metagenome TaxID=412755 RepID=A0A0F9TSL2_9ZZZZ
MGLSIYRDEQGRLSGIDLNLPGHRFAWIGRSGMGSGSNVVYNSHWYDLQHPLQRYSRGETRFMMFWSQLGRGIREFVRGSQYD